jgi:hypothetical protein
VKSIILIFLFSFNCFAQTAREISPQSYQIYVRPQMINIQQDIQQVFLSFPGYPAEVFESQKIIDQLIITSDKLKLACPNFLSAVCMPQINEVIIQLRSLERVWWKFESKAQFNADGTIGGISGKHRWLAVLKTSITLKQRLEIEAMAIAAERTNKPWNSWEFRKMVHEIENMQNIMIIDFIPSRLQEDFRSAWTNFFRPLYKQTILTGNKAYLTENINKLNFYWNILNMKLTKRLRRTPEGMSSPLNAIQNRWNQVLRIYFGN